MLLSFQLQTVVLLSRKAVIRADRMRIVLQEPNNSADFVFVHLLLLSVLLFFSPWINDLNMYHTFLFIVYVYFFIFIFYKANCRSYICFM